METIQLTKDEQNVLESVYGRQTGYNPRHIEKITALNAQEQKFFAGKNFVSSHFFLQTLYKVKGTVKPIKFNVAVNKILNDNENLRANFCNVGKRTIKLINPAATLKPEIIFRNLMLVDPDELNDEFRKILEADMRRDCDLRHDQLIRFAVYKTADDEFAVLVTVLQVISPYFDAESFFAKVLDLEIVFEPKKSLEEDLPLKNQENIRDYWAKVLNNPPPPASLPFAQEKRGSYRQKSLRIKIPADILSDLRGKAQSNRLMLTAILQSAWGFMLQLTNNRRDCLFCQILSANDSSFNVIPVRLASDNISTVEKLVRAQFRQLIVSQPYSRVDWADLEILSGKNPLFDHFLSFKEFKSSELNYIETPAAPEGKIILQNSWDAQGMKLGVYFRYSEKDLSISFLYDEKQFKNSGVERLCKLYEAIIQQMLTDWNAKYPAFMKNLSARINLQAETKPAIDDKKKIRDFLSQLPILQGRYEGTISLFENNAEIITYYEGDRISGDMLKKKFIFVVEGKLARNVDAGDGWYNPIDVVKKNSFVNPTNLLDKQRLILSAEVLTEQVELLTIPHDVLIEIIRKNPEVAMSVMNYAIEQMERYQALWLQS